MKIVYKLTDQHMRTHRGCRWVIGEWKETDGTGEFAGWANKWLSGQDRWAAEAAVRAADRAAVLAEVAVGVVVWRAAQEAAACGNPLPLAEIARRAVGMQYEPR